MVRALLHRPVRRQAATVLPRSGGYVTDGRKLFRVVSQFAFAGERLFASLEDCLTLDVRDYSPGELYAMRLQAVRTDR